MTKNELLSLLPELQNKSLYDDLYIDNLVEYYKSIDFLSKDGGQNLEFNNKDKFHAIGVMSKIFDTAQEKLEIFSGNFATSVTDFDIYINSLTGAINRGVNVSIVFESEPDKESKCLKRLNEFSGHKNLSIKKLNQDYLGKIKSPNVSLGHFLVGDNKSFRYETDTTNYKAFCNMDDKKTCAILSKNHAILKLNSSVYSI